MPNLKNRQLLVYTKIFTGSFFPLPKKSKSNYLVPKSQPESSKKVAQQWRVPAGTFHFDPYLYYLRFSSIHFLALTNASSQGVI